MNKSVAVVIYKSIKMVAVIMFKKKVAVVFCAQQNEFDMYISLVAVVM